MISLRWTIVCWFALLPVVLASDLFQFEPRDGLLVLRNGNVLAGRITPLGESYVIVLASGAESRVPRAEVDFDCRTLDEAYLIKRDAQEVDDVKVHLQLANWCLTHELLSRASDQLLVLQLLEPNHPQLAVIQDRLTSRAEILANPAPALLKPAANARALPAVPSQPEIPPLLMQQFTTTIQPILFSRCANFACHGGGSSPYHLVRPSLGQAATSNLTQRNLHATLMFIDRERPDSSRLLTMAQQPHGGVERASFHAKTGNQLALLFGWVRRLGAAGITAPSDAWSESVSPTPRVAASVTPAAMGTDNSTPAASGASNAKSPPGQSGYVPRDEFDPEVFNRKYHPQR
jgi:hypothetical protein